MCCKNIVMDRNEKGRTACCSHSAFGFSICLVGVISAGFSLGVRRSYCVMTLPVESMIFLFSGAYTQPVPLCSPYFLSGKRSSRKSCPGLEAGQEKCIRRYSHKVWREDTPLQSEKRIEVFGCNEK